jgi:hypothetical protein
MRRQGEQPLGDGFGDRESLSGEPFLDGLDPIDRRRVHDAEAQTFRPRLREQPIPLLARAREDRKSEVRDRRLTRRIIARL